MEGTEVIHDVATNYFGKLVVSCTSDGSIGISQIVDMEKGQHELKRLATVKGHDGPVWQASWAHPSIGNMFATGGYDGHLVIWKQDTSSPEFKRLFSHQLNSSVNSVQFCPVEFGCFIAAGTSDGHVTILGKGERDDLWAVESRFLAHRDGCNAVSWAPPAVPGSLVSPSSSPAPSRRLATAGCDGKVYIWKYVPGQQWTKEQTLEGHQGWVMDVAFAPNIGMPGVCLASCSQDKTVLIWTSSEQTPAFTAKPPLRFEEAVWRVSWSETGTVLAVSHGDNKVSLFKESVDGQWACLKELTQESE